MALARWAATVGGYTMGSRVLGFLRDILIASVLGAGPVADAFFVAFKLPNFLRRLFAEGAFNAAFVPLFAGVLERDGRAAAKSFAEDVLTVLLWTLLVLVIAAQIVMPWLMHALAPGFADEPGKLDLTVQLTRLTFPYILLISLVSLLGGVLNSLYRFAAVAATPILLNLCLIGALLGLSRWTETPGHALAIGVTVGGIVQFVWLIVAASRAGMSLRLRWPRLTPGVKRLLILAAPAALGAGVAQINLVVDIIIASLLPPGSVSFLYYADRVNQLPLGVVGVAVGTALLPLLSRQLRAGEVEEAVGSLNRAIEMALLLAVPAAVALIVIAGPVIAVLFERGAFGVDESSATAGALIAYAAGLPAFVLIKVLAPGYFARQDTRTPVPDRDPLPDGECRAQPRAHGAARPCWDRAGNHARRLAQRGPSGRGSRAARLPQAGRSAETPAAANDRGGGRHGAALVGDRTWPGDPARNRGSAHCVTRRSRRRRPRGLRRSRRRHGGRIGERDARASQPPERPRLTAPRRDAIRRAPAERS